MKNDNYIWNDEPYPYLIIDNFLPTEEYRQLSIELDETEKQIRKSFRTPLERKTIYSNISLKENARRFVSLMSSDEIKSMITEKINCSQIISLGELHNNEGISPFHVTHNDGYLGSHIDHSCVKKGFYRHIANTIFYASSAWDESWGGNTILFSKNGFFQKELISPIPNRLIVFIHTANSFHGVSKYKSHLNIERRSFYHDYYIPESDIDNVISYLNTRKSKRLTHTFHTTTFIPFFPFGINKFSIFEIFNIKNIIYFPPYLIYLFNCLFRTRY